ncbi:MAG: hypothetical protein M3Y27_29650 [Acidobacteriota bacterium]|nr:hypothetical protein [Acidobacteriota bacterium]
MSDKVCVKLQGLRSNKAARHTCERRESKRLLCADLVQLQWVESGGTPYREIAILENLSLAGVGLFTGVAVPEGVEIQIVANDVQLVGHVKQCTFRENGYIVGLELDSKSKWAQAAGRDFLPEHLLDVSLLDLD